VWIQNGWINLDKLNGGTTCHELRICYELNRKKSWRIICVMKKYKKKPTWSKVGCRISPWKLEDFSRPYWLPVESSWDSRQREISWKITSLFLDCQSLNARSQCSLANRCKNKLGSFKGKKNKRIKANVESDRINEKHWMHPCHILIRPVLSSQFWVDIKVLKFDLW
jgi:hypothetical protein